MQVTVSNTSPYDRAGQIIAVDVNEDDQKNNLYKEKVWHLGDGFFLIFLKEQANSTDYWHRNEGQEGA